MDRYVWSQRSRAYLCGVVCLVLATVLYAVGHVAPYWVRADPSLNIGIWFLCPDNGSCFNHSFSSDEDYLKATRILQVLGLVGMVGAIGVAIFYNCRRKHLGSSFVLEVVITLSALLGLSGAMVYLGYSRESVEAFQSLHYDWAFYLNVAACILALVAALLIFIPKICCCNHDHNHHNDDTDAKSLQSSHMHGSSYLEGGRDREGTLPRRYPGDRNAGPYNLGFYGGGGPYLNGGFNDGRYVDWNGPASLVSGPYTAYYGKGQYVPSPLSQGPSPPPPQPPPQLPLEDYHSDREDPSLYVVNTLTPRPGLVQVLPRTPHTTNLTAYRRDVNELEPLPHTDAAASVSSHRPMRTASGNEADLGVVSSQSMPTRVDLVRRDAPAVRRLYEDGHPRYGGSMVTLPPLEILVPAGTATPPTNIMELTPFRLPRVVIRGHYDPVTRGYPEYMMM
ncbi:uncharacterized protein [Littorina saxatilis]|uniref:Uncharacterized protein n=1 Tax=Littorina saxatilis TaxID=31220 RepID=A0AAN9BVV0_9CAEN